jgi:ketosteroid isomerase-like protein
MTMRLMAVDWSGAWSGAEKRIWLAEARDEQLVRLEAGRDRDALATHLIAEAERDPGLVVGLDFAFSLPAWFLSEHELEDAPALWALAAEEAERWLAECAPPFWGRPGRRKPNLPSHFRLTDRAAPATANIQPKSPFQIGGAGAVGTGSLRGMPLLHRLRAAGFAIWPFDGPAYPLVVEVYPRLLTGPVVKSSVSARQTYLATRCPDLSDALRALATSTEDAFDAAVSASVMALHLTDLIALPPVANDVLLREGIIWSPSWREWHLGDARVVPTAAVDRPGSAGQSRLWQGIDPLRTMPGPWSGRTWRESEGAERVSKAIGENGQQDETLDVIERFNVAFGLKDVAAVMELMTDDCIFENTFPPPDGEKYEGQPAVRAFWERFFASSPTAAFEQEEIFACDDRCVVRWVYRWGGDGGTEGHVRGLDVFRVRDGKVAEKLSYVKG